MTTEVQPLAPENIERPAAPAAPAAPAPQHDAQPAEMTADQQAGVARIGELMREAGDPALEHGKRDALNKKIVELQRHVFNGDKKPAWYGEQKPDPRLTDQRPHDPMRELDRAMATPASAQQVDQAVRNAVVQGVDRNLAQTVAQAGAELGLCESHVRGILDVVRAHHGRDHEYGADSDLRPLSEREVPEWLHEGQRLAGGAEKFATLTQRARDFLEHKGVLAKFDQAGLTNSTLAFDPRLLIVLASAADAAGLPRKKS